MGGILILRAALSVVAANLLGCTAIAGYDDRDPRPDETSVEGDSSASPQDSEPGRDVTPLDDTAVRGDTDVPPRDDTSSADDTATFDVGDTITLSCATSTTSCGGRCVDLTADPLHCGACGAKCNDQQYCDGTGKCACRPGLTVCGGQCVDLAINPDNCGGCGIACDGTSACGAGSCKKSCAALTRCSVGKSGSCISPLANDSQNCGGCGKRCSAAEVCIAGTCRAYSPGLSCTTCPCDTCGTLFGGAACCAPLLGQHSPVCVAGSACP